MVLRSTLKGLLARKVRLAMSALAIVLGVAFVVGSYVFTDTLDATLEEIFSDLNGDVVVRPESALGIGALAVDSSLPSNDARTIPASLVTELAGLAEAARADGLVESRSTFVLDRDGRVISGGGAPGIGVNWTDAPNTTGRSPLRVVDGRPPETDGEVVLDVETAHAGGYRLGDEVRLITSGDQADVRATLVGTAVFGQSVSLAGATLAFFDVGTAQRLLVGDRDVFTTITIAANAGITQEALRSAVEAVLPDGYEARTGAETSNETSDGLREALGFFTSFLLVFAAVALFVGTFLILNTFSILVAQRTRELALYRALGASRRQVTGSVLVEALVVGLFGATAGLLAGLGVAKLLEAGFGALGLDLGTSGLVVSPRTVVIAYVVGVAVTMAAAYLPARRAARVAPVAAMRDDAAPPVSTRRVHQAAGGLLALAGAAATGAGLYLSSDRQALLVGAGMAAVFVGIAFLAPVLVTPIVRAVAAWYPRLFGTVGVLARENALRNPRRTAATASALMIGLALVAAMAVIGQSTNRSIDRALEDDLRAEFVISNAFSQPFSPAVATAVAGVPGVTEIARVRLQAGQVNGVDTTLVGADVDPFAAAVSLELAAGRPAGGADDVLLSLPLAEREGVSVGEAVRVALPTGEADLTVAGIFIGSSLVGGDVVLGLETFERYGVRAADWYVYVRRDPAASPSAVRAGIEAATARVPTITVKDQDAFAAERRAPVNQLLALVYALLGLAVLIAVLGIVNTLALSVMERTREMGLLRAVGMSRRQLRAMIRLESVAIAILGAVLGLGLGVMLGIAVQAALSDEGLAVLAVPGGQLVLFVGLAVMVGVVAAVWPARRAAKLDVLSAIATE